MFRRILISIALLLAVGRGAMAADYVLITLLHTNDLHGRVMPSAQPGLAKLATLVRGIRGEMPNVVLLDGGDVIHGSYEDYLSGGRATISAMNAAGYGAAAVGNHEFDFGLAVAQGAMEAAAFPMVAANLNDRTTGGQWGRTQPYVLLNVQGVRISVLGLTTPETTSLQWPPSVEQITIADPMQTTRKLVPVMRQQSDVVVVLSHLGFPTDKRLAASVPGIDFIIGGHTHTVLDKWQWVENTLVAQAGEHGRYLGRIDFIAAVEPTGAKVVSVNGKDGKTWNELTRRPLDKFYPTSPLIPVLDSVPDDESVLAAYQPYREQANAVLEEVIAEASEAVSITQSESGETAAANLVADAIRAYAGSDIAVVDTKSVASGLLPGTVRVRNAFDMIGGFTRQRVVVVRMKGKDLVPALASNLVKSKKLKLQVSGATLAYQVESDGRIEVSDLIVGGMPVRPDFDYTVAGQAYVIQDLIAAGPSISVVAELQGATREAIVEHIRNSRRVSSPGASRIVSLDDRWAILRPVISDIASFWPVRRAVSDFVVRELESYSLPIATITPFSVLPSSG